MNQPNIIQIADWILANRRGKAFLDYSREQIINELANSVINNSGLVSTNDRGVIDGVVTCKIDREKKLCYVQNILANHTVMKRMLQYFNETFPSYHLYGIRHGKEKHFNRLSIIENKLK